MNEFIDVVIKHARKFAATQKCKSQRIIGCKVLELLGLSNEEAQKFMDKQGCFVNWSRLNVQVDLDKMTTAARSWNEKNLSEISELLAHAHPYGDVIVVRNGKSVHCPNYAEVKRQVTLSFARCGCRKF